MGMWVRDKDRHSPLMKKRVSDSPCLAEGLLYVHRPISCLGRLEIDRENGRGGSVEVTDPQEVSDYAPAMRAPGTMSRISQRRYNSP